MIKELKLKRMIRKDTEFLDELVWPPVVGDTPDSDAAMMRYLIDSIAWLDSFDE